MLMRLERKLAEVQRWVDSVGPVADWPAAIALGGFRSRPAEGHGLAARVARTLFPYLWVRPARLNGLWVRIDPSLMSAFVIYEEVFIAGVYDFGRLAFTPDAIIDCGAFEGYFSLLASARFPIVPIVAFEPNADNFAGLVANITRNRLAIDARPAAVSSRDGTATFSGGGCGGHLGSGGGEDVEVPITDLRRVIAELRCDRLLLKLDIEGEEASLLPALLPVLPRACAIFFEWHQGSESYETMARLLDAHGFTTVMTRESRVDAATVYIDALAQRH